MITIYKVTKYKYMVHENNNQKFKNTIKAGDLFKKAINDFYPTNKQ